MYCAGNTRPSREPPQEAMIETRDPLGYLPHPPDWRVTNLADGVSGGAARATLDVNEPGALAAPGLRVARGNPATRQGHEEPEELSIVARRFRSV